jgi:ketosteroid isomerase-like protein
MQDYRKISNARKQFMEDIRRAPCVFISPSWRIFGRRCVLFCQKQRERAMDQPSLEHLDQRLRLLEDIEAIRTLRMKYHQCVNDNKFADIEKLYTDDAVVVLTEGLSAHGRAEIIKLFQNLADNVQFLKQFIHNHLVEVKGDEAEGVSYLDARYANGGTSLMVAGRLRERYRRTEAGWRISETLVDIYFGSPVSANWLMEKQ